MNAAFTLRTAKPGDEDVILALLHELAVYEKLLFKFKTTRETVARDMIGEHAPLKTIVLHEGEKAVGLATWYFAYSSFAASRGIYLEDLFVRPEYRGRGYGKALLAQLAKEAVKAGATKVEWAVLTWNKPSIDFYESLGAERVQDWYIYGLSGEALAKLGS